jgi:hypothetical protein
MAIMLQVLHGPLPALILVLLDATALPTSVLSCLQPVRRIRMLIQELQSGAAMQSSQAQFIIQAKGCLEVEVWQLPCAAF